MIYLMLCGLDQLQYSLPKSVESNLTEAASRQSARERKPVTKRTFNLSYYVYTILQGFKLLSNVKLCITVLYK